MGKQAAVIGGGAAGMFASIWLAKRGWKVTLLEKNEKLGKKIFITGKGRCNFTNACDEQTFFGSVMRNPKFLYSAWHAFSSEDAIRFFEDAGMPVKVERGNRAFPVSDHAYDVTDALKRQMKKFGVRVVLNAEVTEIIAEAEDFDSAEGTCENEGENNGKAEKPAAAEREHKKSQHKKQVIAVKYIKDRETTELPCSRVIIATGGLSYPTTGSTGDGYRFAETLGHSVTERVPSLVPLLTEEDVRDLAGLSLKNVTLTLYSGKKKLYSGFGEMLFTHRGISGPLVLTASSVLAGLGNSGKKGSGGVRAEIDLKPAMTEEELDQRLVRMFSESGHKNLSNLLRELYPASMISTMLGKCGFSGTEKAFSVSREKRRELAGYTKHFPLTIIGNAGFPEAVITKGGVSVKEIDPGTMESKKVKGLYFAGEVIDVDGLTGGFNLQIAWSTSYLAGNA